MKRTNRFLSAFLAICMMVGLLPMTSLPAMAATVDNVSYIDANGDAQTAQAATEVTATDTAWTAGWYVVQGTIINDTTRYTVTGDVHLILADGASLQVTHGIQVQDDDNNPTTPSTNSLTIYAQSGGTGSLIAASTNSNNSGYTSIDDAQNAAIGGNGAYDYGDDGDAGGTITINGGNITAKSQSGAGIGGGRGASNDNGKGGNGGDGGSVTINGGNVTAQSAWSAGIGGGGGGNGGRDGIGGDGGNGGTITIIGGTVTALSTWSAGIGGGGGGNGGAVGGSINGGAGGNGGTITISGGTVTATSEDAAGIGGGDGGDGGSGDDGGDGGDGGAGGTITISGGTVEINSTNGVGIGGGEGGSGTERGTDGTNGDPGTFATTANGNAFIVADSIAPTIPNDASGIIFEGNTGTVYGTPTLETDATVPDGATLTIPKGTSLTIASGKTLTIGTGGKILNRGTISGTVTPASALSHVITFDGNGALSGSVNDIEVTHDGTLTMPSNGFAAPANQAFRGWAADAAGTNILQPSTDGHVVTNAATYYAIWGTPYAITVNGGSVTASTGGTDLTKAVQNNIVTISADVVPGSTFREWSVDSGNVRLANETSSTTTFVMTDAEVEITATFNIPNTITITGGTAKAAGGNPITQALAGNTVTVEADVPAGSTFKEWTSTNASVQFDDKFSANTTFPMPNEPVSITATFNTPPTSGVPSSETPSEEAVDDIRDAQPGDTVELELSGNNTTVDREVFEELAGKDITLDIIVDDVIWTVHGEDIPEGMNFSDIDFGVTVGSDSISASVINEVTGASSTVQISIEHDGLFGFPVKLTVDLDGANEGYYANLYYFNEQTEQLEFRQAVKIPEGGLTVFDFSSASDYVFVISEEDKTPKNFTDVLETDWFYDAVMYATQNELFYGTSETEFSPDVAMNRAMMWTVLARMSDIDTDGGAEWFTKGMEWAMENEISDGTDPMGELTREQLVTMLWRYANSPMLMDYEGLAAFSDISELSLWAQQAMAWAHQKGIITGTGNETLAPQGEASRAQVATMLMRYLEME